MSKARNRTSTTLRLAPLAGVAGVLFFSCMATPPSEVLAFDGGRVRAADAIEAERVETLLQDLKPRILGILPDSQFEDLEVWVQERPTLYRYSTEATADAEGLWSPSHRRIMLSRHADHVGRTLAHELTHAVLGDSWSRLPGSLEEGLADHVSAALVEDGATRLRAGRLSSACLATGGLEIDVDVTRIIAGEESNTNRRGWSARVKLKGETDSSDPLEVFRLSAGLSSTKLDTGAKRGYYGLAFLVISRIVARDGDYDALQRLCAEAAENDLDHVPVRDILAAAGLGTTADEWRRAAAQAMGPDEIVELVRMYPDFLVDALTTYLEALRPSGPTDQWLNDLDVRVSLVEGGASISLDRLPFVEEAVISELERSTNHTLVAQR